MSTIPQSFMPPLEQQRPSVAAGSPVYRIAAWSLLFLGVFAVLPVPEALVHMMLFRQDLPVIGILLVCYVALSKLQTNQQRSARVLVPVSMLARTSLLALALLGVALVGHYTVMWGYAFSRDEQMVLFDAEVFRSGHLVARLPSFWAPYHAALNMIFMPPQMEGAAWVSGYRPVNALLHAAVGTVAPPALTTPLLAVAGLFATWRVAVRVLPDDRESQSVAVLLYATSTQVLANAMTSYAMTGHLALNMIWLALFLQGRWYSHLGALLVGVLAIGLHQVAYHPLFAGPFLFFGLVVKRRWALSSVYASVYAIGILFWAMYGALAWPDIGGRVPGPEVKAELDHRLSGPLMWVLGDLSPRYLWTQCAYLVRFVAWEHVLFLPLLLAGIRPIMRSRDPRLVGMVAAIVVLIIAKTILRPYQGHGWGYRYLHGIIGIACIVAAVGWRELRSRQAIGLRQLQFASTVSLLLVTPWLLWQAHSFSGPFARVDQAIAETDADIVVVDDSAPGFTLDLVYNPPYVDRRPVRLLATRLDGQDITALCAHGSMAFVDGQHLSRVSAMFGFSPDEKGGAVAALRQSAQNAGCDVKPLGELR